MSLATPSITLPNDFTLADTRRFASEAWGEPLGAAMVEKWREFNAAYFDDALRPVPIVLTHTQPFGRRFAFCSRGSHSNKISAPGRTITLNVPSMFEHLVADYAVLLHEMVHQLLQERRVHAGHDGEPWRREIMRLTKLIAGTDVWCGRSKTVRVDGRVVRMNMPHPETGQPSLPQSAIATWPRSVGLEFGSLGGRRPNEARHMGANEDAVGCMSKNLLKKLDRELIAKMLADEEGMERMRMRHAWYRRAKAKGIRDEAAKDNSAADLFWLVPAKKRSK